VHAIEAGESNAGGHGPIAIGLGALGGNAFGPESELRDLVYSAAVLRAVNKDANDVSEGNGLHKSCDDPAS